MNEGTWPSGPFRRPLPPADPGTFDLVAVEQYAAVASMVASARVAPTKLAELAGVKPKIVWRLLKGVEGMVGFDRLAMIVAALGLQVTLQPWPAPGRGPEDEPRLVLDRDAVRGPDTPWWPQAARAAERVEWPRDTAQPPWVTKKYGTLSSAKGPPPRSWTRP